MSVTIHQDTPAGHKILIKDVKAGEDIIKYGYPIGHVCQDIESRRLGQ
jgi:D-altronate dehydratase (EC 4.2.1.7)